MPERLLVVDDDPQVQFMLRTALTAKGFESAVVPSAEAALEQLRAEPFDLVLLDVLLEGMSGMEALPLILRLDPQLPVIIMTGHGSREMAFQAMKIGAYDFFEKPCKLEELMIVIRRALERRSLVREVSALSERLDSRLRLENIVGRSGAMRAVFKLMAKVVDTDVTVLLRGESGTGKELIAQAIHHNSQRRGKPFVTLNCVAIPETLLESELFGHEKGSFTGAIAQKPGKFELANTGTIFLDEIGDMSLATQAKILRALQERECERVGGTEMVSLDVRIIAATNKDLDKAVEDGSFREDLYYRLNVFSICIPPLRDRKEDIPPLVEHFVRLYGRRHAKNATGLTAEAMRAFLRYDGPGNVRELENYVQRAVVMTEEEIIGTDCLLPHVVTYQPRLPEEPAVDPGHSLDDTLADLERKIIQGALRRTGGVQKRAADLLGITERSLWHRVKKLGIDVQDIKDAPLNG